MYKGEVTEKLPTPNPEMALPAVMRARLEVVESCITTPTMTAMEPDMKAPFRPKRSLMGAASSDPTNSPTLIMLVMTAKLEGEISYLPSAPDTGVPKSRTKTSLISVS